MKSFHKAVQLKTGSSFLLTVMFHKSLINNIAIAAGLSHGVVFTLFYFVVGAVGAEAHIAQATLELWVMVALTS